MALAEQSPIPRKNVFVLCFDGTGNKFSGTDADSNILKLYRMLDRTDPELYTFYQPGIGTYVASHSMQTTSTFGRVRSVYLKAKDSAVGSSFAEHVMGGYKFLMRYYSSEDDLYFFGFSRGAYTARFLAEMLDHIGLLSAGNEELIRFAWKTYAKWACRKDDGSEKAKNEKEQQYEFMRGFRQTFSRPVRRIRFLGLFDTVNSVPRFESAWMARTKFPYTAHSSAKVIRHAVSIDERRAKFRQDLISGARQHHQGGHKSPSIHRYDSDLTQMNEKLGEADGSQSEPKPLPRGIGGLEAVSNSGPRIEVSGASGDRQQQGQNCDHHSHLSVPSNNAPPQLSSESLAEPVQTPSIENLHSAGRAPHEQHGKPGARRIRRRWSEAKRAQDIQEVWFCGGHGDVGGGWKRNYEHEKMLSHVPLVWMVHEAERAGLKFDPSKMADRCCLPDKLDEYGERLKDQASLGHFLQHLEECHSSGVVHDCLEVGQGLTWANVVFWKVMEYLPFRRMDLHQGKWRAIRWPLPMGETRDIPADAQIHNSVIKRIQTCPEYRPGNLIVGGGGRGVRKAPKRYKTGEWAAHSCEGDPIRGTFVRKFSPEEDRKRHSGKAQTE